MHRPCVWIFVLLFLVLLPGCGEEGPSIDEVLVFDDADVEVVEFLYVTPREEMGKRIWREMDLLITGREDIDYILSTLRALEPISYNHAPDNLCDTRAYFVFHLEQGGFYTVGYMPELSDVRGAASLDTDRVRINVARKLDFLDELAQLEGYVDLYRPRYDQELNALVTIPRHGYSEPGDAPMGYDPYVRGGAYD